MQPFNHSRGDELEIEGARIYFETTGTGRGPALVLLHGGLGTVEDFNSLLTHLPEEFRIVGIDSRGHGRSTLGNAPLTYERIAEDVARVIAHLGLREVSLLGFSDGGIAAYRLASRPAMAVRRLVTVGARAELRPATAARFRAITPESWRAKFPATAILYEKLNPAADFDRLVRTVVAMWLEGGASGYPLDRLAEVTCPTLLVRGDEDPLLMREDAAAHAGRIRGARFFNIPFAGHVAFADQPGIFVASLLEFLRTT